MNEENMAHTHTHTHTRKPQNHHVIQAQASLLEEREENQGMTANRSQLTCE